MRLFKLKPEKLSVVKDWCEKINSELKKEALNSLAEENCTHEIFATFSLNNTHYLVAHMEPIPERELIPSNQNKEINKKHREILKESIEEEIPLETLYDLRL